jgi:hypothetical protein
VNAEKQDLMCTIHVALATIVTDAITQGICQAVNDVVGEEALPLERNTSGDPLGDTLWDSMTDLLDELRKDVYQESLEAIQGQLAIQFTLRRPNDVNDVARQAAHAYFQDLLANDCKKIHAKTRQYLLAHYGRLSRRVAALNNTMGLDQTH